MHRRVLGEERRGGVEECRGGVEEVGKGGGREQHLEAESGGEEGGLEEQHHQVPHRLVVLDGVHALLIHDGVRERWSRSCRGGRAPGRGKDQALEPLQHVLHRIHLTGGEGGGWERRGRSTGRNGKRRRGWKRSR